MNSKHFVTVLSLSSPLFLQTQVIMQLQYVSLAPADVTGPLQMTCQHDVYTTTKISTYLPSFQTNQPGYTSSLVAGVGKVNRTHFVTLVVRPDVGSVLESQLVRHGDILLILGRYIVV